MAKLKSGKRNIKIPRGVNRGHWEILGQTDLSRLTDEIWDAYWKRHVFMITLRKWESKLERGISLIGLEFENKSYYRQVVCGYVCFLRPTLLTLTPKRILLVLALYRGACDHPFERSRCFCHPGAPLLLWAPYRKPEKDYFKQNIQQHVWWNVYFQFDKFPSSKDLERILIRVHGISEFIDDTVQIVVRKFQSMRNSAGRNDTR